MQNESRHLDETSDAVRHMAHLDLNRYPLEYLPRSNTQVNAERLPSQAEMADMELACREQVSDDEAISLAAGQRLIVLFLGAPFVLVVGLLLSALLSPLLGSSIAGLISLIYITFRIIRDRTFSLRMLVTCVAIPIAVLLVMAISSQLLGNRIICTSLFAIVGGFLLYRYGSWPLEFYHAWLHAHPQVTPQMRRNAQTPTATPSIPTACLLVPIVIFLPLVDPMVAVLALVLSCAFACRREKFGLELLPVAQDVLAQFVMYGASASGAPGTWHPRRTQGKRLFATLAIALAVAAPLSVGLCYYFPCRPVVKTFWNSLEGDVLQAKRAPLPYDHPDLHLLDAPFAQPEAGPDYIADAIIKAPHIWPLFIFSKIMHAEFGFCWLVILAILLAMTIPPWVLLTLYRPCLLEIMQTSQQIRTRLASDDRPEWQWYVDRLRLSDHSARDPLLGRDVREAEHLFLGIESVLKFPVLLDQRILAEHAYLVGDTGSGKTSLGIMPLVTQLLRGHAEPRPDREGGQDVAITPAPPMVIIDLKGDPALFHTVREETEERRLQLGITDPRDPRHAFRFFTSEKGMATHHFNPFASLESNSRSLIQVCHLFLDSLSLSHGEGYGRSYYSRKNRHLLYEVLDAKPNPRSFEELFAQLAKAVERKPQLYRDCFELVSTIHALSKYPQIATFEPLKHPEDAIHMPSVLEHSQVVYFWLPAVLESISVREIAKLALYCLISAAIDRQRTDQPTRQAYLVIDEFQRIAGENFRVILEQSRSFGISAILANQSQGDLKTPDVDLRPAIRTNTRFKQYFGLSDPQEIADLCDTSGQEIASLHSWEMTATESRSQPRSRKEPRQMFSSKSETEFIKSRLTINDILTVTDHPLDSIIHVSRGDGYTQYGGFPLPLRSTWSTTLKEYRRRQRASWPTRDEYELETVVAEQGPSEIDHELERETAKKQAALDEKILELFEQHRDDEDPS
ncbi:MAG: TraM recognition domain-containing protein [Planctomycetota bacterium]